MHQRFFLGATTARRPDWERYYSQPPLGENLKEETKQKKAAEKRAIQAADAFRYPVGGFVQHIEVLDIYGRSVLRFFTAPDASVMAAVSFVSALNSSPQMGFLVHAEPTSRSTQVQWFGLDIRDMLQVAALDVMRYNSLSPTKIELPVGMWYYRNFTPAPYLDPYETIVSSAQRANVDLIGLCTFLQVPMPPDLHTNAFAKADLARRLCLRAQLFPSPPELW